MANQLFELLGIFHVLVRHLLFAVKLHVSPVTVRLPKMFFISPTDSAVFTQYRGSLRVVQVKLGSRVVVVPGIDAGRAYLPP